MNSQLNLIRWWKSLWFASYSAKHRRLAGSLNSYREDLERRINYKKAGNSEWAKTSLELLNKCTQLLSEAKLDEAWKCFHEAKRTEIYGLDEKELATRIGILRQEAEKLSDWRKKAVFALIGSTDNPADPPPSHEAVSQASLIRDQHYNNSYYKNQLTRIQFQSSFFALSIFMILLLFYFRWFFPYGQEEVTLSKDTFINYLLGVVIFGLLGATTSTILHIRKSSSTSRIPEIISNNFITLSRIFVGAGFSVFIFILLNTALVSELDIFNFEANTPLDFFALAFITGFSERFVLNRLTGIIGGDS
jgi:hypothetical protein